MKRKFVLPLVAIAAALSACGTTYVTPAGGVSFAGISHGDIRDEYSREPASPFPANVAVIRVQDSGYSTRTAHGFGSGRYSVVTSRDVETDEDLERFAGLPLVATIAPVGRLLVPSNADSIADLRQSAASLRADLLLIYSVDTTFDVDGRSLGPLSMISLGLIPNKKAHVTSTVAGLLVDVRSGFVYGTTEATAREDQRATVWSTETAIDTARLRAEKQAFEDFVDEFERFWKGVVDLHAAAPAVGDRQGRYLIRFD